MNALAYRQIEMEIEMLMKAVLFAWNVFAFLMVLATIWGIGVFVL